MPTIEHKVLSNGELHEPKGASTASQNQTYVADGAGSGGWLDPPTGWGLYAHSGAEQTFNTTAAKISINSSGATTNEAYLPPAIRGTGTLWSVIDNKITPIKQGDSYDARLLLPITSRSTAQFLTCEMDIGGGATPTQVIYSSRLDCNRTPTFTLVYSFPFFTLSTFLTNGGQLFLKTDAGSVGITNPTLFLTRTHSEMY